MTVVFYSVITRNETLTRYVFRPLMSLSTKSRRLAVKLLPITIVSSSATESLTLPLKHLVVLTFLSTMPVFYVISALRI
jgi:hypothetical protein